VKTILQKLTHELHSKNDKTLVLLQFKTSGNATDIPLIRLFLLCYRHQTVPTLTQRTTRSGASSSGGYTMQSRVHDVDQLLQRLMDVDTEWSIHSFIDSSIRKWCTWLQACVRGPKGGHFVHKLCCCY